MDAARPSWRYLTLATLWGVAEGFLFFIVPDVLISLVAQRRGWAEAMKASLAAALGAVLGLFLLWQWSAASPDLVRTLVTSLPGITPTMIETLGVKLVEEPLLSTLLVASVVGVPIKIAAMLGPHIGLPLGELLLLTPLARLPRFMAVGIGVYFLSRLCSQWLSKEAMTLVLLLFWIVFYGAFWLL